MLAQSSVSKSSKVLASYIAVGDVIQDRDSLNDSHPYLVVGKSEGTLTLQACSSHESTYYKTAAIIKSSDKSGSTQWTKVTSYLCEESEFGPAVVSLPEGVATPIFSQFLDGTGQPLFDPYGQAMVYISSWQYYQNSYRVIGAVNESKMKEILG